MPVQGTRRPRAPVLLEQSPGTFAGRETFPARRRILRIPVGRRATNGENGGCTPGHTGCVLRLAEVVMSRMKTVLAMTGVVVAAAAAGCTVGLMVAPASGRELRRRFGWRATPRWRAMSHSCEGMLNRVADRAKQEIEERKRQVAEVIGA